MEVNKKRMRFFYSILFGTLLILFSITFALIRFLEFYSFNFYLFLIIIVPIYAYIIFWGYISYKAFVVEPVPKGWKWMFPSKKLLVKFFIYIFIAYILLFLFLFILSKL